MTRLFDGSLTDYLEKSKRTMDMRDVDTNQRKMTAALGLVGEAGEILEIMEEDTTFSEKADMKKEGGDLLFYIFFLLFLYDIDVTEAPDWKPRPQHFSSYQTQYGRRVSNVEEVGVWMLLETSKVADHIKKECGHNHPSAEKEVAYRLHVIFQHLCTVLTTYDISFDEVAEGNIAKLLKRYPDGFSSEASLNRAD